jgi:hypothetical protein
MTGLFPQYQPLYAEHGISAFPVSTETKTPLVANYLKMGIPATTALTRRFTDTNALGIAAGKRNGVTVLDVDTTCERILVGAIERHGEPRIIVRTASRKFHGYYRFAGEPRKIRPWPDRPIDLLGGGYVIVPPSLYRNGRYEIIKGTFDDLAELTTIKNIDDLKPQAQATIGQGRRNNWLWRECMKHLAHADCDNLAALITVAKTFNERCNPKMEDTEVMTISASAWTMHQEGRNRFGQHGAWIPIETIVRMAGDSDALFLYAHLKANEGPWARFMILNTLAEKFGWTLKRLQAARSLLIQSGYIEQIKPAYSGSPALYRWDE